MRYLFAIFFILSGFLALISIPVYEDAGMIVFENPSEISNSIYYFLLIIFFTAFVLFAVKYKKFLTFTIHFLVFLSIFYVLYPFTGIFSFFIALIVVTLLLLKPHWSVIDFAALMLAAGISAIFGISLEPTPVIVLMVILAIYDALAVYKTKHMIKLAESVTDLRAPMLFVLPSNSKEAYMGVGDVVMPCILAVSAQKFLNTATISFIKIPAIATLLGSVLALIILIRIVEKKGGAYPGLPFVNSGAIAGYLVSLLVFT